MATFWSNLLDYFFYRKCYLCSCKLEKGLLCEKCFNTLKSKGFLRIKRVKGIEIKGFYSYGEEIQRVIKGIKYYNKKELAGSIAKIMYDFLLEFGFSAENTELIPVPQHPKRIRERNYNHMEVLSDELAKFLSCEVNTGLIKRVKNTLPQYKLSPQERRENLKGAFKVTPKFYTGKNLVLFDDISTTGVTMEEMIKELKKKGIHNVTGLAIAFSSRKRQ